MTCNVFGGTLNPTLYYHILVIVSCVMSDDRCNVPRIHRSYHFSKEDCSSYLVFSSRTSHPTLSSFKCSLKDQLLHTNDISSALETFSDSGRYKLTFYLLTYMGIS